MMYGYFKDAHEAKRFLDWKVQKSFKVFSQTTKTDAGGNAIEYQAELVPESGHPNAELMWVLGAAVHWIQARNLEDAVELKREYKR